MEGQKTIIIKDEVGESSNYPISILPYGTNTIDGSNIKNIVTNYGNLQFYSDGVNNWMITTNNTDSSTLPVSLQSIASLSTTGNEILYTTASNTYSTSNITSQGRNVLNTSTQSALQSIVGTVPNTNVQVYSIGLTNISTLSDISPGNQIFYATGSNSFSPTTLTVFARSILDDPDANTVRNTLGLGTIATENIPSGGIVGISESQSLTNKIITDVSNTIRATQLGTTGEDVKVSLNGQPSTGQVLTAINPTTASWSDPSGNVNGPNSSTTNAIPRYSDSSGKQLSDTSILIDNSNNITGVNTLSASSISGTITTPVQHQITSIGVQTQDLNMGNFNITNVNLVSGVGVSALKPLENVSVELGNLSNIEIQQLQNIGTNTISNVQWGYINQMNQRVDSSFQPTFAGVRATSDITVDSPFHVISSATPTDNNHLTNKAYVDNAVSSGAAPLEAVDAATSTALIGTYVSNTEVIVGSTTGLDIDFFPTSENDEKRYLIKDQSDNKENGIYTRKGDTASGWVLERTTDFNSSIGLINANSSVFVAGGTATAVNRNTGWALQSNVTITDPLTDPVVFIQTSAANTLIAGSGIQQVGNQIDIVSADSTIEVKTNTIQVSPSYAGNTSLSTLGTITEGTWNGKVIELSYGGVGATTIGGAQQNLGLVIGTNVQAQNSALQSISGLTTDVDNMIYTTASNVYETTILTGFARSMLNGNSAIDVRNTLQLGTIATESAPDGDIVGTISGQTLTNKSLVDNSTFIINNSDPTKKVNFDLSNVSTSNTRVFNFPNNNDTIVGTTAIQSISNKIITDSTLTDNTNVIRATQLATLGSDVVISGSTAPIAGQVLVAKTPTTAEWGQIVTISDTSIITVGKTGSEWTTIKDAIIATNAIGATSTAPIKIVVGPGLYVEDNPLTIPSDVCLTSFATNNMVIVNPANVGNLFTLSDRSTVIGIQAKGVTTGVGWYKGPGVNTTTLFRCQASDCKIGYQAEGSAGIANSSIMVVNNCVATGILATMENAFLATNGGIVAGSNNIASGFFGRSLVNACHSQGNNSYIDMTNCNINYAKYGYLADGSTNINTPAKIRIIGSNMSFVGGPSGGVAGASIYNDVFTTGAYQNINIEPNESDFNYSNTFDLVIKTNIAPNQTSVLLNSCTLRGDLIDVDTNADLTGIYNSLTPGEKRTQVVGELGVGSVLKGFESAFGEGDSHTLGMTVLTYNTISGFSNITNSLLLKDGISTSLFKGVTAGNELYIGSEYAKFPNLRVSINTGITPAGGKIGITKYISHSYSVSTGFTGFNLMSTDAAGPYLPHADNIFNSGEYQYRFGNMPNWTQRDVGGVLNKYWIKFRIESNITVVPTADQLKLGPSRKEINSDGFVEYFGNAEPYIRLPFDVNWFIGTDSSPQNQNLYIDKTLSVGRRENSFRSNATNTVGFVTELPDDLDTSLPFNILARYMYGNATSGNIVINIRWGFSTDYVTNPTYGDIKTSSVSAPVNAPGLLGSITAILPVGLNTNNRLGSATYSLDVSRLISLRPNRTPGDLLWVALSRFGGDLADTYAGDVYLLQVTPFYTTWSEGSYRGF